MTRLLKFMFITTSLFLLSFNVYANTKIVLDVTNLEWSANKFIYDDTIKTVELINVPKEINITYQGNSFKEIGTYFAKAIFSYDTNLYQLKGYDRDKFESFSWTIIKGYYNTSNIIFKDSNFVYDGNPHSLYVNNVPSDVEVEYLGNSQVEPGIYQVTAIFKGNPYYTEIPNMIATLTINKKELLCDAGECKISSSFYGFNPTYYLKHTEVAIEEYSDIDLSKLGSYREIKSGFKLSLCDSNGFSQDINDEITVEIRLSESLLDNELLEIYEYSSSGISKVNSNKSNDTISFSITSFNSEFLIIGMRETYSQGDNWKIGIIFIVIVVFIVSLICIKKVNKKNKFK